MNFSMICMIQFLKFALAFLPEVPVVAVSVNLQEMTSSVPQFRCRCGKTFERKWSYLNCQLPRWQDGLVHLSFCCRRIIAFAGGLFEACILILQKSCTLERVWDFNVTSIGHTLTKHFFVRNCRILIWSVQFMYVSLCPCWCRYPFNLTIKIDRKYLTRLTSRLKVSKMTCNMRTMCGLYSASSDWRWLK